jgi:hypothetical protein
LHAGKTAWFRAAQLTDYYQLHPETARTRSPQVLEERALQHPFLADDLRVTRSR